MATRSICPVACTLDLIGDKWTLLIMRDLLAGKLHRHDFSVSPERIATNILSARLQRLQEQGLVKAAASPERAGASASSLTPRERALSPVLMALKAWGLASIPGTQARVGIASQGDARGGHAASTPRMQDNAPGAGRGR